MNLKKRETLLKNSTSQSPFIFSTSETTEIFPLIMKVECQEGLITAHLDDGRIVSIPTAWYPRTREATIEQLNNYRLTSDCYAIHWPQLDEHLSVRAFLKGLRPNH